MKKFVFTFAVIMMAVLGSIFGYRNVENKSLNPISLANIEALSNDETIGGSSKHCSRAIAWANCYDRNGYWAATRITQVESYNTVSVVEVCSHDKVTQCPLGTHEGF